MSGFENNESSITTQSHATTSMNATPREHETFKDFFDWWLGEQELYLHELISATTTPNIDTEALQQLISRVMTHYTDYYHTKSRWAKRDILSMMTPSWKSSLEGAFSWIGEWRPTMAFHLLYSKAGLQLDSQLPEILRGVATNDLSNISSTQLTRINELQRRTLGEEKELNEKIAKHQESMADTSMVEMSHIVTDLMRSGGGRSEIEEEEERVDMALELKEETLKEILQEADDLRLKTLRDIVDILTPIQAVHLLIAAAELHLGIHSWGKIRDEGAHNSN